MILELGNSTVSVLLALGVWFLVSLVWHFGGWVVGKILN